MRKTTEAVFYAETYHPIQVGSIDGTDTLPHDSAVYRAWLCSSAGLYDPSASAVSGDPYCTLFVARLSPLTTEDTLRRAMSRYGRVKNLRLVRHIVTGASRGYAFVEFETERDMRRAYKEAHHSLVDDYEVIVDYNRQQLMPGWIPRRLGGGFGGKKESGQLRFGGRERPFRAPIRIPYDDLKKLGIPPPPEGRYVSRHEVPSPPRRKRSSLDREEGTRRRSIEREVSMYKSNHVEKEDMFHKRSIDREYCSSRRSSVESDHRHHSRSSRDREGTHRRSINREASVRASSHVDIKESFRKVSVDQEDSLFKRSSVDREERSPKRSSRDREDRSHKRSSGDREERSHKRHKSRHYERSTSKERSEEI